MPSGLFELRKDPITGWWVATMVERTFHRDRFARAGREPRRPAVRLRQLRDARDGDGVRVRMLSDYAFHVVGTDDEARELDRDHGLAQVSLAQARATGSWRTIVAPPREHRALHLVGNELIEALLTEARDQVAAAKAHRPRPTTSRSSRTGASRPGRGPTTCASTSTTCPRSRTGSPRSSAAPPGS